ncbi:LysR family transcriptional regulator [Paenibacillus sp. MSJ-34]|uniref:LysR family transcriptional regulator n=1 Tax=Paenibacillus sp. MSJ-34 TaxID=2841529 RepID=UPI001C108817|nr:LysR family transcriptional regulator [Paenibacillus sp. MSJ-34]MBU5444121.1 LysR family transcriptional regulator [Paenibacillus sp. MSJ-34]
MELNDLRIFQRVALHGSISKAAAELNYVQSNVTARIKQIEKELQTPLFYRHQRGMILTAEGRKFREYADKVLLHFDDMMKAFQDSASAPGSLEIGMVETIISLPAILSSFYRKYPQVDLSLKAGVTEQLVQDVLQFKVDGAFVTGPINHPLIEQYEVFQEELVLVSAEQTFGLEALLEKPLLVFNHGCGYRQRLENWLRDEGIVHRKMMEFGTFETIIGSVAAGLGVTVVPRSAVAGAQAKGMVRCYEIPEEHRVIKTVFIRRKDAYMTNTLNNFIRGMLPVPLRPEEHA